MARKTLTFVLLALMALTAHAQHFDWVKSYIGESDCDGLTDLTSRPQATYLLTLTTIGGKTHTIRLMKMSDIFSR